MQIFSLSLQEVIDAFEIIMAQLCQTKAWAFQKRGENLGSKSS